MEAVYATVLPRHQHPWAYLSLELDPTTVDVNVHPTKSEVQFLSEEVIAQRMQEALAARLRERGGCRTFGAHSVAVASSGWSASSRGAVGTWPAPPSGPSVAALLAGVGPAAAGGANVAGPVAALPAGQAMAATAVVTWPASLESGGAPDGTPDGAGDAVGGADIVVMEWDADGAVGEVTGTVAPWEPAGVTAGAAAGWSEGSLAATQPSFTTGGTASSQPGTGAKASQGPKRTELNPLRVRTDHRQRSLESVWRDSQSSQSLPSGDVGGAAGSGAGGAMEVDEDEAERREAFDEAQHLSSVCELKAAAALVADAQLSKSLNQSVYVGPVSRELVLLQCGAALCLANLVCLARECAYQRVLRLLGGPGSLMLKSPLPLQELLRLGVLDPASGYDPELHVQLDVDALVARFVALLEEKAELLGAYFMLGIEGGKLYSLPNALGVASDAGLVLETLPLFLLRLCTDIDWADEKPCLDGLCRLVAEFAVESLLPSEGDATGCDEATRDATSALNAAVSAGQFEDVATAAIAMGRKRQRTVGPQALQELRWLHEAVRRDGSCQWQSSCARDGTILELVSLDQLYRIFERC